MLDMRREKGGECLRMGWGRWVGCVAGKNSNQPRAPHRTVNYDVKTD